MLLQRCLGGKSGKADESSATSPSATERMSLSDRLLSIKPQNRHFGIKSKKTITQLLREPYTSKTATANIFHR
jgi:hypothetical protein